MLFQPLNYPDMSKTKSPTTFKHKPQAGTLAYRGDGAIFRGTGKTRYAKSHDRKPTPTEPQ